MSIASRACALAAPQAAGVLERDPARGVLAEVLLDLDGERVIAVPLDRNELVDRRQLAVEGEIAS